MKVVLFDLDGTLWEKSINEIAFKYHLKEISRENVHAISSIVELPSYLEENFSYDRIGE